MGEIEEGVRETLALMDIKEPRTAPEKLAIMLAKRLDDGVEDKSLAGISLRLSRTLEEVRNQPKRSSDAVGTLIDRQ